MDIEGQAGFECPQCGAGEMYIVGYEIRGIYDGVLIWGCRACKHKWPRFDAPDPLHKSALRTIKAWERNRKHGTV